MSLRIQEVLKDYCYHWSQTLVPCQIQVLSSICLLTLGNPLLGKHLRLDRVGETSLSQNISLRRGDDTDLLQFLPLLNLPLCLLIREVGNQRGPDTHIRRGEGGLCHHLQSMNDYGRYKKQRQFPQVVDIQSTAQPVKNIDETLN